MTIDEPHSESCTDTKHYNPTIRTITGIEVKQCCGKIKINRTWTDDNDKIIKYIIKKVEKLKLSIVTDKQLEALIKRELGISLNSTERSHLHQYNKKIEGIKEKYYEINKLQSIPHN